MKTKHLLFFICITCLFSCDNKNYYSENDFSEVEKIDAHYHIYTNTNNSLEQAERDNFQLLNINTYSDGCENVVAAHQELAKLKSNNDQATEFTATFCLEGWDEPGWVENTRSEERRVGKECRSRWSPADGRK